MCVIYPADAPLKTAGSNMFAEPNNIPPSGPDSAVRISPVKSTEWVLLILVWLLLDLGPRKAHWLSLAKGLAGDFLMKWVSAGKCQLLKTQTFRGSVCTTCNKNGIPGHSGRKGKQRKTKKGGGKFFAIPELEVWVLMIFTWDAEVLFQ